MSRSSSFPTLKIPRITSRCMALFSDFLNLSFDFKTVRMFQSRHIFFWVTLCIQPLIYGLPTSTQPPFFHPASHSRGKRALTATEGIFSEGRELGGGANILGGSTKSNVDAGTLSHINPGDLHSTKIPEINPLRELNQPETPQPDILQLGRNPAEETHHPASIDPTWSADWKRLGLDENLMTDLFIHLGLAQDSFPKPNFEGVRSAAEAERLRSSAPFNDRNALDWFLKRFDTSKLHRFDPEELHQTLQYYISRFWDPQDFDQVSDMPSWVIQRYVKEWTENRPWNTEKLTEWGGRLGISDHGVALIDEKSKAAIAHLVDSGKQYIEWFENANMASLSSSSQRILNINARYVSKELWWTAEDVAQWTEDNLPVDLMVELGEVLHLAETSLPADVGIPSVRLDMVRLLKKYESVVYQPATENKFLYRSLLANELDLSTPLQAGSVFQQRMSAIGLTDAEKTQFSQYFRKGDLRNAFNSDRSNHFLIQFSINRLDFEEAEKFTNALSDLYQVSEDALTVNKDTRALIMRWVLPPGLGGEIKDWSTYRAYIKIFEDALGAGSVRATIAKNVLLIPVNKSLGILKIAFNPLTNWLSNLIGRLRQTVITRMTPLKDFSRDLSMAWKAFNPRF